MKQGPEVCDDGKNNGKYGYCQANCLGLSLNYCGDDKFDVGKEVCDASVGSVTWRSWDNENLGCPMDATPLFGCVNKGEKYNRIKSESCSWDCQSRNYCGDGFVNQTIKTDSAGKELGPYEQCEKNEVGCSVGKCSAGAQKDKYCEKDADCWKDVSCQITTSCLEYKKDLFGNNQCIKWKKVCSNDNSLTCSTVNDCDIKCVDKKPGKRYCAAPGEVNFIVTSTAPLIYMDDVVKWPVAAQGNAVDCKWHIGGDFLLKQTNSDVTCMPLLASTPKPSPSSCGNGKIEAGEVCDDGKNNGVICTPIANAKTCTYCAFGCQQVITKSK